MLDAVVKINIRIKIEELDLFPMLVKSLTPQLAAALIARMISSGISVPENGKLDVSVSVDIKPDEETLADIGERQEESNDISFFESWVLFLEGDLENLNCMNNPYCTI